MNFVWRVTHLVGILLGVAAAVYLFAAAVMEGSSRDGTSGGIVAIATVPGPSVRVVVGTGDGSLYTYNLADSAWYALGSVPNHSSK